MAVRMSACCRQKNATLMFGVDGGASDAARARCFERNASAVTSLNGAIVSSLAAKRIAPRMSPSSSLLDTLAARLSEGERLSSGFCCGTGVNGVRKLPMAALTFDAKPFR